MQPVGEREPAFRLGIITSTFPFGSGEMFLEPELEALCSLPLRITVFPATPQNNRNAYPGIKIDVVRFALLAPGTLFGALRGFCRNAGAALNSLRTLLKGRTTIGTKLKNLALFPTGLAVADEVCRRSISHLHAYWLSGASTVALVAARVANIPWSYSAHSWDIFMADNLIPEKASAAAFGRVISELGRHGIEGRAANGRPPILHVVHLGVSSETSPSPIEDPRPLRSVRILCPAAVLIPVKGQQYLIEALPMVIGAGIDCQCTITGDGPLRKALLRKMKDLDLEEVVSMPGRLPHGQLLKQLHDGMYDVVVLPSVKRGTEFEGIPVSLMEAMAAGIPCVATDTGAIAELMGTQCGILVGDRDAKAIADAIVALALKPSMRKAIRESALRFISEQFDANKTARTLAGLLTNNALYNN